MFIASQVPDADRMQPKRATKPARTDERRLATRREALVHCISKNPTKKPHRSCSRTKTVNADTVGQFLLAC